MQAGEKLYKSAEEVVKTAAALLGLSDVLESVEGADGRSPTWRGP